MKRAMLGIVFLILVAAAILPALGAEKTVTKPKPKATFYFPDRTVSCEYSTMTVYPSGVITIHCTSTPITVMKS